MFASSFEYHRATSLADAQRLLAANPGAKLLAGGHSLLPAMKLRLAGPSALIDIGRVAELQGITSGSGGVRIGAMSTHLAVATSGVVKAECAVVAETAAHIGDPAVRNRGTIGGSVAHADPGADYPTVLTALGATIEVTGASGSRSIAASDFFQGVMTTALADGEIVTAVVVPSLKGKGAAYAKFVHPASRYAVIGAAAVVHVSGGTCSGATVVVGGLTSMPTRLPAVEAALKGKALDAAGIAAAAAKAAGDLGDDVMGDVFASGDYRRGVVGVWVARALTTAAARAK
ncbi:MAG: xanthine dehydrogenase family protein subunit M [Vicinamibacterales bacterium]